MGKSSSSFGKKRRSKYSSQARARKKSKTRRSKSKKLRRRSDSYSDDDSRSSLSISSSDSEYNYRSRRSRSRSQKDLRGSKKRALTRSSSIEESPRVRKQKGSKRYHERKKTHEKKTKKRMKKKVRRDTSISSGSIESMSCSTCQSSSSDSDVSEYEMRKGGSKRRKDENRELKMHNWEAYEPDMMNGRVGENTSKRLRSVITFAREDNEGRELEKDKHKEEITYDHHDYPSRSNDSNEGLNSRESAHQLRVASEKERPSDDKKEDDIASNTKTTEPKETERDGECEHARNKAGYYRVVINDTKKENYEVSRVADGSAKGDDLETILRQKALENLRRFRRGPGGVQTNVKNALIQKDNVDGDVMAPSLARSELTQIKSTKDDDARVIKEDSPHSVLNENFADRRNCGNEARSAKNNVHMPDQVAIPVREKVSTVASSSKDKPRFITSALREPLSNVTTTLKETPASGEANQAKLTSGTSAGKGATPKEAPDSQKPNQAKLVSESSAGKSALIKTPGSREANKPLLVTGSSMGMSATHSVHTVIPPKGCDGDDKVNNAFAPAPPSEPSSCIASMAGGSSLNKSQGEGKEDSQFEQKTMSVLRGGETVQVSYKVYIPKKTPALSRRQQKR